MTYVGKDSEKLKHSLVNVADGFGPSLPDGFEVTASKSLALCDSITSSDAAAMLPPRETVIATFPSSYSNGLPRQALGEIAVIAIVLVDSRWRSRSQRGCIS